MPSVLDSPDWRSYTPIRKSYSTLNSYSSSYLVPKKAPINQLYRDVLERIFTIGVEEERNPRIQHRFLLSLSQVCFSWRVLAHSLKSLWALCVDFENLSWEWNNELLGRSFPHPISIGSRNCFARHFNVISAELNQLHRIQSYHVSFNRSSWDVLTTKLSQPAPLIRHLDVNLVIDHDNPSRLCLPRDLFDGHAPNFRSLALNRCWVDFSAPVVGGLTSLSVSNLSAALAPSVSDWCSHLLRVPNLEELILINAISAEETLVPPLHHNSSPPSHSEPVQLRYLAHLNLNNGLQEVASLLQKLLIPIDCDIITGATNCQLGADLDVVATTFSQALQYTYSITPSYKPLRISLHGPALCLSNHPKVFGHSESRLSSQLPIHYLYIQPSALSSWEELLPTLLRCLTPVFDAMTLFEPQLPIFHPTLLGSIMRASNLDTFSNLTSCMTKGLLPHLQCLLSSDGGVPLPALQNIYFADDESMWGPKYRTFVCFLRWRSSMQLPIRRVSFHNCAVLKDTIFMLESMGISVDTERGHMRWQNL
ncbi:hypothetical protein CVT24_008861 [Panaeolus cyanescens]|uniref:F-box domain-containing protein n=1 Tax=Panaeolus cyanescens TaxID=181874 RepID=A0A409VES2_9AGAR|nr:hypothetical protein CVT24_008861 [Panaeolus cyanescens]